MSTSLTDEEKDFIIGYINDIHDFYALECVYLIPGICEGNEEIAVTTVLKENFFCKGSILERPANMEEILKKDNEFGNIFWNYQSKSKNTRLYFSIDRDELYFHPSFAPSWLQALVSGNIIYDSSSKFTQLRNSNIDTYKPYSNLFKIENLDQVDFVSKGPSLKKKNRSIFDRAK